MKLKYQLLLLGLLSLIFPLTGWYALKSVDFEFRQGLEQAANNNLSSLQASIDQIITNDSSLALSGLVLNDIEELTVDGYDNEWDSIQAYLYTNKANKLSFKIARYNNQLALLIQSNDQSIKINPTNFDENDLVLLGVVDEKGMHQYKFYRQAEGSITPLTNTQSSPEIKASWHENSNGYILELILSTMNINHIGVATVNISDQLNNSGKNITGTLETNNQTSLKLLQIVSHIDKMQLFIDAITPNNNHFIIKDDEERIIYQSNKLPDGKNISSRQWLITPIYQWLFGRKDETNQQWFYRQNDGMAGVLAQNTINGTTYQLKSMMPQGQQSMVQTLLKASLGMMAVVLLLIFAYLVYSLWLAWRIRRLNNSLHKVLDESGKLTIAMPSNRAKDEIGQLSRGIETMLIEMQEYTQYLKDLGLRLSHEMKTPLAIVQSSLDNLKASIPNQDSVFLTRAQDGLHRLKFILNQLSQLSQLKHSLETTQKEKINLTDLCNQLGQAYQSYIPQLTLKITKQDLFISGSNELIAQLIDKIIDNAIDFTPKDGEIILKLEQIEQTICLSITNTGSQLAKGINVFESMQSKRELKLKTSVHLGLGLYLVQLISRYHRAKTSATNLNHPKRVQFSLIFTLFS